MSDGQMVPVTVRILDREYQVACPQDEKETLLDSARDLNERMKTIRETGKVVGVDRIAVMAALNLSRELIEHREQERGRDEAERRLRAINRKLESALDNNAQG